MVHLLFALALIVGAWQIGYLQIDSSTFPGPLETSFALWSILGEQAFHIAVWDTISISMFGLLGGLIFAYFVGFLVLQNKFVEDSTRPTINAIRAFPSIILMPLVLVTAGSAYLAIWLLTVYVVFAKLFPYVIEGIKATKTEFSQIGTLYKLSKLQVFFRIQFPTSARYVITGIQLSSSRAYGTVILGGLFIGSPGLGNQLNIAREMAAFDQMFAYGFLLAVFGVVLYQALLGVERRMLSLWGSVQ